MASGWRLQQKEKLVEHLFSTALKLFRRQGYEKTTVQQITEWARVAKGTFFNHFPTKEHVLSEWYRRMTLDALETVEARTFRSARAALVALAAALAAGPMREPDLWDMKSNHRTRLLADEERSLDERLLRFCVRRIEDGKQSGELDPALDSAFFASTVRSVLTGTGHEWTVLDHGFDLAKVLKARTALLFKAAGPS